MRSLEDVVKQIGCFVCGDKVTLPKAFTRCTPCLTAHSTISDETWKGVKALQAYDWVWCDTQGCASYHYRAPSNMLARVTCSGCEKPLVGWEDPAGS